MLICNDSIWIGDEKKATIFFYISFCVLIGLKILTSISVFSTD